MSDSERVEYRIELSATFDVDITSSVLGPSGLDRAGIEELIEKDWMWISADKHILQESSWELVDYTETDRRNDERAADQVLAGVALVTVRQRVRR